MKNSNKAWLDRNNQALKSDVIINAQEPDLSIKETKIEVMTPEEVQKLEKGYFVLVPGFLRIRNGPGINFEEVGTIFDQNRHYVFEENNGWGRIGDDQWIMLQYTEKV